MDPLLIARIKRARNKIRFKKQVEHELTRLEAKREKFNKLINDITKLRVVKMACVGDFVEYMIRLRIGPEDFDSWCFAKKNGFEETVRALIEKMPYRFARLISKDDQVGLIQEI